VDVEEHQVDPVLMDQEIDNILVSIPLPRDVLASGEVFEGLHLVAELEGPLVVVSPGSLIHLDFQRPDDLGGIALEDIRCLPHQAVVVFPLYLSLAGSTAGPERCPEAPAPGQFPAAPETKRLFYHREHVVALCCRGEWAEIRTLLSHPPGNADPRKLFIGEVDVGILLGILQIDIEPGLVGLDEAVLKNEGLDLVSRDDVIDISNQGDENPGLAVVVTLLEVA